MYVSRIRLNWLNPLACTPSRHLSRPVSVLYLPVLRPEDEPENRSESDTTPGILARVPEVLVRARGLTKRFGSFTAVDGIDFDLYRGEAFGFLGPNGAGEILHNADDRLCLPTDTGRAYHFRCGPR